MADHVQISDTTLRDGEQAAGVAFGLDAKVEIARQLNQLGVDEIEAGFPSASAAEIEAIQAVSKVVTGRRTAVLLRALRADIDAGAEALKFAEQPVATVVAPVSDLHIRVKFGKTHDEVLEMVEDSVRYASKRFQQVIFSGEDATRTDLAALERFYLAALSAGASMVSIPDTVGYAQPEEFGQLVAHIRALIGPDVGLRIHCHNDLGVGVANSLAAVRHGANIVSCTFNGIGERAGNAALEEIVAALAIREDYYRRKTRLKLDEIYATSQLVSRLSGVAIGHTKPIVGDNAFAHSAGIHQHGVLRDRTTYEIASPQLVGAPERGLVIGKHTGHHGLRAKLTQLRVDLPSQAAFDRVLAEVKLRAHNGTDIDDATLLSIVDGLGR
ncbi:homocitrate synthase/isopropylmalate synthase family protein [Dactylosporangium sp. CS-033363]|uniref:homocitrate synthase/isopropylmalate synthase family protein n=1 Tax=Dactylosporangium sp. CS-033363 TaxID=3239935 RepID=UPI003D8A87A1